MSTQSKTLSVRPGRKKVTSSFVCDPQIYNEFTSRCPKYGDKSYVLEELLKQFLSGATQVPARTF